MGHKTLVFSNLHMEGVGDDRDDPCKYVNSIFNAYDETTHHSRAFPPSATSTSSHFTQSTGTRTRNPSQLRWCLTVRARTFVDGAPVEMYVFLLSICHSPTYRFLKSVVGVLGLWANTGNSEEVMAVRGSGQRKRISIWREKSVGRFRDVIERSCMK